MQTIFSLSQLRETDDIPIGGKGSGLVALKAAACRIPATFILSCSAYDRFMDENGLREKIAMVLNRKPFSEMRWEEIWDTALRVKSLFLTTPMPESLGEEITTWLMEYGFTQDSLLAIRSSSPDEDQDATSFAGLHASYLNIPPNRVLHCIRKVWASLWSDKALLYRQELGLSVEASSMAVILQKMIHSDVSGVCFTQDPLGSDSMIVEAVYGLNQGLVDGEIEPDRWFINRLSGAIAQHSQPENRHEKATAKDGMAAVEPLSPKYAASPPLLPAQLDLLWSTCLQIEQQWQQPLDIEWTLADDQLYMLQARPISTLTDIDRQDRRPWYLSLHRSFTNLHKLRNTLEQEMLPAMDREAARFGRTNLQQLSSSNLAEEIQHRSERNTYWTDLYWQDCIPFAHGVRLFGEVYNELLLPEDPYEFVTLLQQEKMLSTTRNSQLLQLAEMVKHDQQLRNELEHLPIEGLTNTVFKDALRELTDTFGFFIPQYGKITINRSTMITRIILEFSQLPPANNSVTPPNRTALENEFIEKMAASDYPFEGVQLLDLARASYRIRDDDNIFLGKIEQQVMAAVEEGRNRCKHKGGHGLDSATPDEIVNLLKGGSLLTPKKQSNMKAAEIEQVTETVRARQVVGQPASQGIAKGRAHVIDEPEDLLTFKAGEILITESIDPNMTFIVPLAAAIIEKRGGMLIHGAIIAREYGIPCITGVANALDLINTGDQVVVDGYLGIVTIAKDRTT